MKKNYLFLATAAVLMASCANDDFSGDNTPSPTGTGAIAFNMNTPAMSRAITNGTYTDGDAAGKLNNMFLVWGEKNEIDGTSGNCGSNVVAANTVFQNYRVDYKSNTANTTTSNTDDWEYVGATSFGASVSPTAPSSQTIKYWDEGASSYTFTAVSARADEINSKVGITKIIKSSSSTPSVYDKGYTIEVKEGASTGDIYFSDRVSVTKNEGSSSYTHQPVTMTFRNFQSKIRFGIYETVPGYKVVITGIKYNNGGTAVEHPTAVGTDGGTPDKTFGVDGEFVVSGTNTKYTVTYESEGTNLNRAKVEVATDYAKNDTLRTNGTNWLSTSWTSTTTNSCIGESAPNATFDKTDGSDTKAYTSILPNPSNSKELKLTIKYDLYSEDTGEKISVDYKTVTVPAEYCQWKSNYAYTYLFKISDKSAELYPITFDACVETEDNGNWESITEVSEPSITTFGVKDSKVVTGKNEYEAGTDIYATVMNATTENGSTTYSNADLSVTSGSANIALYTVTYKNNSNAVKEITEASVANCIAKGTDSTNNSVTSKTVTDLNGYTMTATPVPINASGDTAPVLVTSVPGEDGVDKNISALKWTPSAAATYAIQYTKDSKQYYKIVKVASSN